MFSKPKRRNTVKKVNLFEANWFDGLGLKKFVVHDSPYFKILNFNFRAGRQLPVHSHDIEGQLSILALEWEGEFFSKDGAMEARSGDMLVCEIAVPHGIRATSDMRTVVTIAPPM